MKRAIEINFQWAHWLNGLASSVLQSALGTLAGWLVSQSSGVTWKQALAFLGTTTLMLFVKYLATNPMPNLFPESAQPDSPATVPPTGTTARLTSPQTSTGTQK